MQIIELYRYRRADGGVTVSPVKPEGEYEPMYRLVADEGKALTQDGINLMVCADVYSTEGWYEVDAPEDDPLHTELTRPRINAVRHLPRSGGA